MSNRFAVSHDRKKKLAMSFLIERLIKQLVRTYFLCVVSCNLKHTHTGMLNVMRMKGRVIKR